MGVSRNKKKKKKKKEKKRKKKKRGRQLHGDFQESRENGETVVAQLVYVNKGTLLTRKSPVN